MKKVIKRLTIFNYIEILLIIITILLFVMPIKNDKTINIYNGSTPFGYFEEKTVIEAPFISTIDDLDKIGIPFSTFSANNNYGKIKIEIMDDNDKLIHSQILNVEDIKDNSTVILNFDMQKNVKGKIFKTIISTYTYDERMALTVWLNEATDENLYIKKEQNVVYKSLSVDMGGEVKNKFYAWYPLLLLFVIFTLENTDMKRGKK